MPRNNNNSNKKESASNPLTTPSQWPSMLMSYGRRTGKDSSNNETKKKYQNPTDELFYTYANASSGLIEPEGIETLCTHVGIDHTDVRILMLAWKLQAKKQGYFTLEEWQKGLKPLGVDTLQNLKKALNGVVKEMKDPLIFVDFYAYAFNYCLLEDLQKTVEIESICVLLNLVLGPRFPTQIASLVQYLETQSEYKVITMDQWMGFYRFLNEISPDLSNYSEESSWPIIIDEFVDWMREKKC